jgi:hypothetical protein
MNDLLSDVSQWTGDTFRPAPLLDKLAAEGKTFASMR